MLMTIGADRQLIPTPAGYLEIIRTPSVIRRRELVAGDWHEEQVNCFCCSCGSAVDPCCRNHGWWATRPCELHGMAGEVDEEGVMPASVQEYRHRVEARS